MKIVRWILLLTNLLLGLMSLTSYVSVYIEPSNNYYISIFGLILPYLIIANVFFVLFWTILGKKYFWVSVITLLLGTPWIRDLIQIEFSEVQQSKNHINLVTFNMFHLKEINKAKKQDELQPKLDDWKRKVRVLNGIDILCIQENNGLDHVSLPLTDHLTHSHVCSKRGIAIFTSYPIINQGCLELSSNNVNSGMYVDLLVGKGDTLRVYNIHLQSNKVSSITDRILTESNQNRNLSRTKTALGMYLRTAAIRAYQMEKVLDHMEGCAHPIVLCGDFNDGSQSYIYNQATKVLQDAFTAKGSGFSATYRKFPPFLRIDHVLYSSPLEVTQYEVMEVALSDHYPVFVSIDYSEE